MPLGTSCKQFGESFCQVAFFLVLARDFCNFLSLNHYNDQRVCAKFWYLLRKTEAATMLEQVFKDQAMKKNHRSINGTHGLRNATCQFKAPCLGRSSSHCFEISGGYWFFLEFSPPHSDRRSWHALSLAKIHPVF